ncbi:cytochrome c [Gluconacetobacter azotocaptans]|uniref:Cytochrome c n=1 Tax=Gluconacetobacter azotocaptans TaxID=142834 RepID=A0A7W4PDR7_9PROT|nr:cytochrome c [Gluconacetobacter azotocaptans]MBB2188639.1 cytochrome c [Gluconacetobacter azotocaptans]MBM9400401.1 cytochrome c [Gluconacetobacter azotocaptans]GBQ35260.1 cytochrome c precursor [Gluconacetobacter azotocaptans DSM 13594]
MRPAILLLAGLVAGTTLATQARADSASAVVGHLQPLTDGASIYQHVCQGCHMPDGRGAMGSGARFPALAGNAKLVSADYPAYVILNGFGGMPSFAGLLTDKQVADVVNYVRTHFGNHYTDALKPADVAAQRPAITPEEE